LGTKWAELVKLMHKLGPRSRVGFFATNAPDPPYLNPNSCFGHFGPFITTWTSVQKGTN
jgi:hypothetical protein